MAFYLCQFLNFVGPYGSHIKIIVEINQVRNMKRVTFKDVLRERRNREYLLAYGKAQTELMTLSNDPVETLRFAKRLAARIKRISDQ